MSVEGGLLGALSRATRECPRGHGPMQQAPGWFYLPGCDRRPNALLEAVGLPSNYAPNNQMYVVTVFKCQTCQLVELVDPD